MESAHIRYHESLVQSESSPAGNCDSVVPECAHGDVRDEDDPVPASVHQIPPSLECGSCGLTFNIPGGDLHAAMLVHIQNPVHKLAMRGEAVVRRKCDISVNVSPPYGTRSTGLPVTVSPPYRTRSTTLHSRQSKDDDISILPCSEHLTSSNQGHYNSSAMSAEELTPSNTEIRILDLTREISTQTVTSPCQQKESQKRAADCDIDPNPKRGPMANICCVKEEVDSFIKAQYEKMSSEDKTMAPSTVMCTACSVHFNGNGVKHYMEHMFGKRHLTHRWCKTPLSPTLDRIIAIVTETLEWLKQKETSTALKSTELFVKILDRALPKLKQKLKLKK